MGLCKDCANWSKAGDGGYCTSDKIGESSEVAGGDDVLIYSYNEGGTFWTGPNFGCVHFKEAAK